MWAGEAGRSKEEIGVVRGWSLLTLAPGTWRFTVLFFLLLCIFQIPIIEANK